jgi:hypothetical protein
MEPLGSWWRREWAAKGFCHNFFLELDATCRARMREEQAKDDLIILKLYALCKLSQSIQSRLEDNPTTDYNRRMEAVLLPALTAAVADLDAGGTDAGPLRRLIIAESIAPHRPFEGG